MGYQEELTRIQEAKASMRQSIINKGVDVPEDAKIEMYPDYIAQIVGGGGGYDPNNPTLEGLKAAIDAGDYAAFPVGTEIPDTYDGNSNPLIVAQYLDSTNNSAYGGAEGVILVRKYMEPTSQQFGSSMNYATSAIKTFLDTTYLNNCSEALKSVMAEVNVPYNNTTVKSKMFLMSDTEVCAAGYDNVTEGVMWDYWKQKTGLSSPNNSNNNGRIMKDRNGTAKSVWLRSRYDSSIVCSVNTLGYVSSDAPAYSCGVLPACFIARGGGDLPDPTDKSLTNLKASLDAGVASQDEYFPIGTKLPDFYAGNNSAWKVVHYGTATLGENSIVRDGVYLQQDFVYECVPLTSANYSQSNMISLLNSGQIYDKLSDEIKALVSEIKVPYTYSNTSHKVSCQFFIPSATELGGEIASNVGDDGVMFDYYKQFISTPTNGIVTERIQRTESGVATDCWTRTSRVGNLVRMLTSSGSMSNNGAGPYYASIVCFIAKS